MCREDQWIAQDKYKRQIFVKYELKRLLLKSAIKNESLPYYARYISMFYKSKITRFSTIGEQRNRCVISGRVWNVLKKTKCSRFVFRTEAYHGNMPGCKKASW